MSITVALVYPDLLGTYGDSGNAAILAQRLRWRGHQTDVLTIGPDDAVPTSCELYVIGGGEDLPQALAAAKLSAGRPLHRAVEAGAVVLAICAGLQNPGPEFRWCRWETLPRAGVARLCDSAFRVAQSDRRDCCSTGS